MKTALKIGLGILLVLGANAQSAPVLMFLDGTGTPLARAISTEKECSGITTESLMGRKRFTWSMAQGVGNGKGQYEIWLENTGTATGEFLGNNVNKAAKKACRIILGKEPWAGKRIE